MTTIPQDPQSVIDEPQLSLVADAPHINYHTTMENEQITADLQQIINHYNQETTADPQTLLQTALTAYQTARTDGLCHEGAYEIALQTLTSPANNTP